MTIANCKMNIASRKFSIVGCVNQFSTCNVHVAICNLPSLFRPTKRYKTRGLSHVGEGFVIAASNAASVLSSVDSNVVALDRVVGLRCQIR
ncbi:hypothetical protein LF1_19600 [Rubripirellula obstinata]|uniref:Uncharacterized protein n=1 Tax=Rubripirellula obstinata TaxID=406547 RepID=A0A5B1CE52_9BACT|nr:hypothetical protein LF1_19600 [Rubripirellula obstinata]